MLKTHKNYLNRLINFACLLKSDSRMLEAISHMRAGKQPVYQMMRDIVCDARFYGVIENEVFWKRYSSAFIEGFIDSLTPEDWADERQRTIKKEDFLTSWMERHILPLTLQEQRKIEEEMGIEETPNLSEEEKEEKGLWDMLQERENMDGDINGMPKDFSFGPGVEDATDSTEDAKKDLPQELKDYLKSSMKANDQGREAEPHEREAEYLSKIDPALVELARKIGRSGNANPTFVQKKSKFQTASKCDINGVTTGNDLNCLLPSELALLASPVSEKVFLKRYVQKSLQVFSSASSSTEKGEDPGGPIYVCIDTSSSMSGDPEAAAKKLALAIAIIAQSEKRPLCVVNYSFTVSFFMLTDFQRQKKSFLTFLSNSYSGGNDENRLFRFVFTLLPQAPKYREFAQNFRSADMLIISDYQWGFISEKNLELVNRARRKGMKIYGLHIGNVHSNHSALQFFRGHEEEFPICVGPDFYFGCDYKYVYADEKCFEYKAPRNNETKNET